MEIWSPLKYLREGKAAGRSEELLQAALEQARRVQTKGMAAVITLAHLAKETDTSYRYLQRIVVRRHDPYRVFAITKRPTGYRTICVPEPPLLHVQRWLHRYVLSTVTPHGASHAYFKGSSPQRCAAVHSGSRWLVKLDIRQFFESISEIQVFQLFHTLGYEPLVSFEL